MKSTLPSSKMSITIFLRVISLISCFDRLLMAFVKEDWPTHHLLIIHLRGVTISRTFTKQSGPSWISIFSSTSVISTHVMFLKLLFPEERISFRAGKAIFKSIQSKYHSFSVSTWRHHLRPRKHSLPGWSMQDEEAYPIHKCCRTGSNHLLHESCIKQAIHGRRKGRSRS